MAIRSSVKKRNPQDSTLRNVRSAAKRLDKLEQRFAQFEDQQKALGVALDKLRRQVGRIETPRLKELEHTVRVVRDANDRNFRALNFLMTTDNIEAARIALRRQKGRKR